MQDTIRRLLAGRAIERPLSGRYLLPAKAKTGPDAVVARSLHLRRWDAGGAVLRGGPGHPPWIDPGNLASFRVAGKIGMTYEREVMFDGYTHPDHLYAISKTMAPR